MLLSLLQQEINGDQSGKTKCPTAAEDWIWHVLLWATPLCSAPQQRLPSQPWPPQAGPPLSVIWPRALLTHEIPEISEEKQTPAGSSSSQMWLKQAMDKQLNVNKSVAVWTRPCVTLSVQRCGFSHLTTSRVNQPLSFRPRYGGAFFNELISFGSNPSDSSDEDRFYG